MSKKIFKERAQHEGIFRENITVVDLDLAENRSERRKVRSNWGITINSNIQAGDPVEEREIREYLKKGLESVLNLPYSDFLQINDPRNRDEFKDDGYDRIKKAKVTMVTEIGPKVNRVHLHAVLEVVHHTIIQLKLEDFVRLLKERILEISGGKITNPYVHVRFLRGTKEPMDKYLKKNPSYYYEEMSRGKTTAPRLKKDGSLYYT